MKISKKVAQSTALSVINNHRTSTVATPTEYNTEEEIQQCPTDPNLIDTNRSRNSSMFLGLKLGQFFRNQNRLLFI